MKTEEISFRLISLAGDAMGKLFEANQSATSGQIQEAQNLLQEANQLLNQAHNEQTKLMVAEANGNSVELNVLLVHAQDTLMNTVLAENFMKQMIQMNQRILELEKKAEGIK